MNLVVRLAISAAAGIGGGIAAALIVTVIDLYVTGHGYASITREVLTLAQAGVHLSVGDVAMLITALVGALATWYVVGRDP